MVTTQILILDFPGFSRIFFFLGEGVEEFKDKKQNIRNSQVNPV